jgi:hypothetical protein
VTYHQATALIAKALTRLADEHGRPNTFSPAEVFAAGGPPPMMQGRIGSDPLWCGVVWGRLGSRKGWGSCPVYSKGRWAI